MNDEAKESDSIEELRKDANGNRPMASSNDQKKKIQKTMKKYERLMRSGII